MPLSEADIAVRSTGLGSSDISAVVGVNPYRTSHDVYLDKRGLAEPFKPTLATRLGHIAEGLIADLYCEETGAVLRSSPTIRHPEHEWIVGTPDRLDDAAKRLIEIKWVGWRVAKQWERDDDAVPDYVRCQCEWLMGLTGCEETHVPVILGGDEFRIYTVKRNVALYDALVEKGRRFWFDNVVAGVPPPVDHTENARRMVTALHRVDNGKVIAAPEGAWDWVHKYLEADARMDAAKDMKTLAGNKLREMIGDAEGFTERWGSVTWRASKTGVRTLRVKMREAA